MTANFIDISPGDAHPDGIPAGEAPEVVAWAQSVYRDLFRQLGELAWIDAPEGPLAYHWANARGQSATYLINLATTLKRLHDGMTSKSPELFWRKVSALLRPSSDQAFDELLVELEVGSEIAILSSPVSFEVLVPEHLHFSADKPKSPDYGLKYFDTLVTIEVTVWHWESSFAWWRMQTQIGDTLGRRLEKLGARRSLRLELPMGADQVARDLFSSRDLCTRIASNPSGVVEHEVGCDVPARLSWQSLTLGEHPHLGLVLQSEDGTPVASGPNIGHLFSWSANPCLSVEGMEDALKSLRRAIERKKNQAPDAGLAAPYLIAIALASSHTDWSMFSRLIRERIWSNPKYHWLSGIIEYTPNRYVPRTRWDLSLALNPNPNADFPVPPGFIDGRMCHWPMLAG